MSGSMNSTPRPLLRFEGFTLDLDTGDLRRDDARVPLRRQASLLLLLLARNRDRLVGREEIRGVIWSGSVVEFDQGINACVRQVRKALGDEAGNPRFIETVPRQGYRFIAAVGGGGADGRRAAGPASAAPEPRWWRSRVGAAAVLLLLAATGWIVIPSSWQEPQTTVLVIPNGVMLEGEAATYPDELLDLFVAALDSADARRLRVVPRTWNVEWNHETSTVTQDGRTSPVDYVVWFNVGHARDGDDPVRVELIIRRADSQHPLWQRVRVVLPDQRDDAARAMAEELVTAFAERL
jgi:DNA-binding winged helix-turn-helix (wHTH) protein